MEQAMQAVEEWDVSDAQKKLKVRERLKTWSYFGRNTGSQIVERKMT